MASGPTSNVLILNLGRSVIYVYATKEQAGAGKGSWIGMVGTRLDDEPDVQFDEKGSQVYQFLFTEIEKFEDKADTETSEIKRPMERAEVFNHLNEKYKGQIRRKYKLNEKQMSQLMNEGIEKGW